MVTKKDSNQARLKRHIRIRSKISGTAERPRLAVYRSNANISAQIIDDVKGVTLVAASTYGAGFTANGGNKAAAREGGRTGYHRSRFRQRRLSLSRTCIGVG